MEALPVCTLQQIPEVPKARDRTSLDEQPQEELRP